MGDVPVRAHRRGADRGPDVHPRIKTILIDCWDADAAAALVEEHRVEAHRRARRIHLQTLIDAAEADGLRHHEPAAHRHRRGRRAADADRALPTGSGSGSCRQLRLQRAPRVTARRRATRSSTGPRPTATRATATRCASSTTTATTSRRAATARSPSGGRSSSSATPRRHSTPTSYLPGGWFLTGDVGRLDDEGFLTITDRKKDVIIRGGENIASKEVEDVLSRHPDVVEVAVVAHARRAHGRGGVRLRHRPARLEAGPAGPVEHFAAAGVAKQKTPERLDRRRRAAAHPVGEGQEVRAAAATARGASSGNGHRVTRRPRPRQKWTMSWMIV